jgi:UDP-N-acetylglucosamine acyltransferase
MATGDRACLEGLNIIGMKRNGFEQQDIKTVKEVIDKLFGKNDDSVLSDRIETVEKKYRDNKVASEIINFMKEESSRAYCELRK